jgi:hypothetical protein
MLLRYCTRCKKHSLKELITDNLKKEMEAKTVNVRVRDDPSSHAKGVMISIDEMREKLRVLRKERRLVGTL